MIIKFSIAFPTYNSTKEFQMKAPFRMLDYSNMSAGELKPVILYRYCFISTLRSGVKTQA